MATKSQLRAIQPQYLERAAAVLDTLQSYFIEMPRGKAFCSREDFEAAYEVFRAETHDGANLSGAALIRAIELDPRAWLIIRSIVGVSPPEAGWLAVQEAVRADIDLDAIDLEKVQTDIRDIDAAARRGDWLLKDEPLPLRFTKRRRWAGLLRTCVPLLADVMCRPAPTVAADKVHRLDKVDTSDGQASIMNALSAGTVKYSELLYERMLGRPYASHRDSVSAQVGTKIEGAIKKLCEDYGIDVYMPPSRVDLRPEFEQAPDALIPSVHPKVIIEAKLTEDDGTARDKAARLDTLRTNENARPLKDRRTIVAVIDGRGFGVRSQDMNKMMKTCEGHVYTLTELPKLVAPGGVLAPFVTKQPPPPVVPKHP